MTDTMVRLRLYVAGEAQNSLAAVANLNVICAQYLPGNHHIELIDVLLDPQQALDDGVLMTPMLIKLAPAPVKKIIGSLSQPSAVLQALGLPALTP